MSDDFIWFLIGLGLAVAIIATVRRLVGFTSQRSSDYEDGMPQFDLRTHLVGRMICEGVIFGPTGRMTSSFVARFDTNWDGDTAVMDEHFTYDDGEVQERQWTLTLLKDGTFTATAPDVIGTGKGTVAGPATLFRYRIRLPENVGGHLLDAFDCMYLTGEGTIVNRSQFRKFGIKVAELVATIRPEER